MFYDKQKIEKALKAFKRGEMIIVVDDDSRENEGDLVVAAQHCTTEQMGFIIRYTSGIICVPLTQEKANNLDLPPMVQNNSSAYYTAFTVSVDHKKDTTTGISAYERALTSRALASDISKADDFVRPGHIFPLIAQEGGVLKRSGHTEAAVDLCKLCDLEPVAVIGELMNDDGTVQHNEQLDIFASQHNMHIISIAELIAYRQNTEKLVKYIDKKEKILAEKSVIIYKYDVGAIIYDVLSYNVVSNDDVALYITQTPLSTVELANVMQNHNKLIYINYQIPLNTAEQHSHAINRAIIWYKYEAIKQILSDFEYNNFTIISKHLPEELKNYKKVINIYDK